MPSSEYKISEAKRLLAKIDNKNFSITNIAIKSGFNTDDSFVTLFKKHTKMTPENYRIKYFNLKSDNISVEENQ